MKARRQWQAARLLPSWRRRAGRHLWRHHDSGSSSCAFWVFCAMRKTYCSADSDWFHWSAATTTTTTSTTMVVVVAVMSFWNESPSVWAIGACNWASGRTGGTDTAVIWPNWHRWWCGGCWPRWRSCSNRAGSKKQSWCEIASSVFSSWTSVWICPDKCRTRTPSGLVCLSPRGALQTGTDRRCLLWRMQLPANHCALSSWSGFRPPPLLYSAIRNTKSHDYHHSIITVYF